MSEAPERIWAWVDNLAGIVGTAHCPETPSHIPGGPNAVSRTAEYIRADLFDAVKAERDNYKALYEAERDDELLNIARQAGYQDGAEDRRRLEALVAECDIYLKEGETPRQRMDRDHLDILALGKMLADDRKRRDEAEARVKALTAALDFYADESTYVTHYAREACDRCTRIFEPINEDRGETARAALQENTDDR